jgi:hypothetical protein
MDARPKVKRTSSTEGSTSYPLDRLTQHQKPIHSDSDLEFAGHSTGGGLYLLPDQQLNFILLSAVLGLLLCVCLFVIGLLALGIFLARGDRHNVFIAVADDATKQGEEIDKGNS